MGSKGATSKTQRERLLPAGRGGTRCRSALPAAKESDRNATFS